MFQRIWQWLKQLWQRWVARQPPPAPTRQPPSDAESESVFMQLLQEVASGSTRGEIQGFLIIQQGKKHVTEADLVAWLRRASSSWLASPAQHQELGRRMGRLGDIYKGEIAEVARDISRQLAERNLGQLTAENQDLEIEDSPQPPLKSGEEEREGKVEVDIYDLPEVAKLLKLLKDDSNEIRPNGNTFLIAKLPDAQAWANMGCQQCNAGNLETALGHCERAIKLDPNNIAAWKNKGCVLDKLNRYEEAIAACERALAIDSNCHDVWSNLGNALREVQRYEEAIAACERALAIDSNYHFAWNNLGNALSNVQRHEEAIAAYERALAIDPNYHLAWNNLGNALSNVQRHEEAIAAYERALAIDSNYHPAWNGLGNALKDVQRYEEAIAAYERALAIDSSYHIAWNGLGATLRDVQRYEEAIAAFGRALAIDSNYHFAWNGLGNALRNVQRYEEAIKKFDRGLQITKDQYWMAWFNRGWAFFESNRYHLAIQNWDDGINKYLRTNRDWKVAHGSLYQTKGRAQYLHGRQTTQYFPYFLEAKTSYQKALEFLDQANELRLEVLQEAIPVCRTFNDATASEYLNQGIEILQDLISAASLPAHKLRLERQFSSFYQLEVDNLVQSGNFPLALTQAEKRKNYCLRWLRQGWIENLEDSPTCEQIHQLLNPGTAIIYWHISPAAITTFLLRQNQPLYAQIFTEDLTSIGADKELYKFETWLKEWKTDYQDYSQTKRSPLAPLKKGGTGKESETAFFDQKPANNSKAPLFKGGWGDLPFSNQENPNNSETLFKQNLGDIPSQENHPWRAKMPERLNKLAEILHIPQILTAVGNNITQIILIPHRDLHLLPLESLFYQTLEANRANGHLPSSSIPAITRLPSAQIGINLQPLQLTAEKQLLNVFGSADELWFPEMEFALIAQLYHLHLTSIPSDIATKQQITAAIPTGTNCFHFTGHGYHNLDSPTESALELTNQERLTLQEIFKLNFQGYHLVSLSACETGITSKQGIIDEYIGLVSGFLAGGVARVVSTLWRVDEFSAALMMIKFHQLFKDGIPPAEALQQAQHWLRTITYSELAQWYRHRAAELESPYLVSKQKLESLARNIENSARINSDQPPFAHPCFWSGFTITGKINNT